MTDTNQQQTTSPQVAMIRPHMDNLPQLSLKSSFSLRHAKPGNNENHQVSGRTEAPFATIVPRSGVGGWAPNPKKLNEDPTRITKPKSRVIFVSSEGRQLGKISLNIIWILDAPMISAAAIYPSVFTERVIL